MTEPIIQPDFRAMRIDETDYWNDEIKAQLKGGQIWAVYVFDKNQVTHCCEITPSYAMHFIEYYGEMGNGEQVPESLAEEIQNGGIDEPVTYIHCSGIDKLADDKLVKIGLDDPYSPAKHPNKDEWYAGELELALEYARCNSLI